MKIYFVCYPHGPAEKAGYEHPLVALAEGLQALGVTVAGNVDYWRNSTVPGDYLIKRYTGADLGGFDAVVFSSRLHDYNRLDLLPHGILSGSRKQKTVLIDWSDGLLTPGFSPEFASVDVVLKTHYCRKYDYPAHFKPWQFGLTNRILQAAKPTPFGTRARVTLTNFRVRHPLRQLAEKTVMKRVYQSFPKDDRIDGFEETPADGLDRIHWEQTGRRHCPAYYRRLGEAMLVNAIGGNVSGCWAGKAVRSRQGTLERVCNRVAGYLAPGLYDRVYQFDSWRFWEALISGCATVQLDFGRYGMELPVNPTRDEHYIGIDWKDGRRISSLLADQGRVESIAEAGRRWALDNYSPQSVATRFLQHVG